jgi:serine/threonine-protein kinase
LIDGRYEVLEEIATGGVGVVYRARRVKLERTVAIKVLHETLLLQQGFVKRFQTEAVALSRLDHPHCVAVLDIGFYVGRPYLVLEYVPGQTLAQVLASGRLPPRRAITIALQLLETLEHFHQQHIVHRDLKAENVMLMASGKTADFVKVLDFGMAKILEGRGADSQLSQHGIVPGTPSAMAPEQIQQLPPDPRIDIYATGILLYEMLVGHRPFRGEDHAVVVNMQLTARPTPPREVLGEGVLSPALEAVVLRALEKDRLDRFSSAAEMAAALRCTPEAPAVTLPTFDSTSTPPVPADAAGHGLLLPVHPPARRWPLVAVAVALVGGGAALGLHLRSRPPSVSQGAEREPTPVPMASPAPSAPVEPPASPAANPTPPAEPWRIHRDLAVTYAHKGQHRQAFVEVLSALRDDPVAAAADPALLETAVTWLLLPEGSDHVSQIAQAFRDNPALTEALVKASARPDPLARRNAFAALTALGRQDRVDLVALRILDWEQAKSCVAVRVTLKKLLAVQGDDPRVKEALVRARALGEDDPHVKCLRRRGKGRRR